MDGTIIFDPLLSWEIIAAGAVLALVILVVSVWRGLAGWWLRGMAAALILAGLSNPSLQQEERSPLSDIVLLVIDESASQQIDDRPDQTARAVERITREVEALSNTELRTVRVLDSADNEGTLAMTALAELLAEEPKARVAGAVVVSDGRIHDMARMPDLPVPLHLLMTGREDDWDRRLVIESAPAFGIIGEEISLSLRIDDEGAVPGDVTGEAEIAIAIDGEPPELYQVPTNEDLTLPVTLTHGGVNVIQFQVTAIDGELTDRNNAAVIQINGVRDRLRVLLVSGEPHPGERVWRNLLKSDSSVDLVHFTILRPPDKQDGVPVTELSLIAFPTRELFLEKIDEFDLIIFDRYQTRGILPAIYLDNIRSYVERGGAVLVAAGPDFASANSLSRSPLGDILPAAPSARVIEEGFKPMVSDVGLRHPVTQGLEDLGPKAEDQDSDVPGWGRWFRLIDLIPDQGHTVMEALEGRPLLVLNRVGEGRVALLGSDHAWLWSRGFEGGGPQLELLKRLAHWMMKEPDLEEEALTAEVQGQTVIVTRRTLSEDPRELEITGPDGAVQVLPMEETSPGRFTAEFESGEIGLFRLADGEMEAVVAMGPAAPREFEQTIAGDEVLAEAIALRRSGSLRIEDGLPGIRRVREGRVAAGRGWIGITPRDAYVTSDVTVTPLGRPWIYLLLAAGLVVGAWLWEGRRRAVSQSA